MLTGGINVHFFGTKDLGLEYSREAPSRHSKRPYFTGSRELISIVLIGSNETVAFRDLLLDLGLFVTYAPAVPIHIRHWSALSKTG